MNEDRDGDVVYVVDGWNDSTQTSVIAVFATKENAQRELERLLKRPGEWYGGVGEAHGPLMASWRALIAVPR